MCWMPTAILGVPHAVFCNDEYMRLQDWKEAGVMWNVWVYTRIPIAILSMRQEKEGGTVWVIELAATLGYKRRDPYSATKRLSTITSSFLVQIVEVSLYYTTVNDRSQIEISWRSLSWLR